MTDWPVVPAVVGLVLLAYVAGLATPPVVGAVSVRLRERAAERRGDQAEVLGGLQGLLVDLQQAAEATLSPGGDRRFLDANLELSTARDRIASRAIRRQVEQYQDAVMNLVELDREEAIRAITWVIGLVEAAVRENRRPNPARSGM